MENSWQMKCGSLNPSTASSTSQELRNQTEMVSSHCFYPPVAQDLRSTMNGRMQDSMYSNIQNIGSRRLGNAELGNSFLALLSGPPSFLQCDPQELPNPNAFSLSCSKLPIDGGGVLNTPIGSVLLPRTTGLVSEHQINRHMQNGANFCSSSRAGVNSNYSTKSVVHDVFQTENLGLQGSDLANSVIHQLGPSNERAKDFSSVKGKWKSASSVNVGKLCGSNIPVSQKGPEETLSSVPSQSSICTSGCPRVICLGASGDLLLSNTGLLGIICTCHHFHMSVAKFCEHLGLRVVNPGDAVHMESGETLSQWRKLYFQKFGIRVPDDHNGWDWPEALPATAGLVKSSVVVPSMPNNSDLAKLSGSSGGVSGQRLDNIAFPTDPHTDQNSVIHLLHEKVQRYGQGDNNHIFKGLQAVADNQKMDCPVSRCSTSSKLADKGPDSGLQSISACIDSLVNSRNVSFIHPNSQKSKIIGKSFDVSKIKNSYDGVIANKVAVSSNIELRLGQPYQQSQSSGNSVTPVSAPKSLDTLVGPSKSPFLEQMIHNAANCKETVQSRQYYQCFASPSGVFARREQSQMNQGNRAFGISSVMDTTTKLEKADGLISKSSVVPVAAQFKAPPERNENSIGNNNMVISDHIMPRPPNHEPNLVSVPWIVGNRLERQLNPSEMAFFKYKDKGKGTGSVIDSSFAMTDKELKIQKQLKNLNVFSVAVSESCNPCFSAVENSHYLPQSSGVPPVTFDARNLLNRPEEVPCLGSDGHVNHVFLRSMCPRIGLGKILRPQAVSMAFPSATSTSMQGMAPAVSKLEGITVNPYLLNENMRLHAFRQILELPKEQHASLALDLDKGRVANLSNFNIQNPLFESSTFGEQRHIPNITSPQNVSEVAMISPSSGVYARLGFNVERTAPMTDLNNFYDFSTSTQGSPLLSREVDLQRQFSHGCLPNKQLSLRGENDTASNERAQCCQGMPCAYFLGQCGCTAYSKCLGGNCMSKVGSSTNTFKDRLGNINGEASMLVASKYVKDDAGPKKNTVSLDQRGKSKEQLPKTTVYHASQWRDVPSKFKGVSDVTGLEHSAGVSEGRGHMEHQLDNAAAKCSYGTMKIPDSLKEREMSNVSSGCSAAAITQASIQISNMDFPTVDAGNTRYVNNHVVDEGSGIDKCWSSDDALESERSAEFLGSNSNFSKEGSSRVLNNQSSRSLLDELKLLDSLTWKKNWNQFHTVHGKVNLITTERGFKTGKRKKARKIKMLEAPFLAAGTLVLHHEHRKGTDTSEHRSSKDVEMLQPSVQETFRSGACFLGSGSKFGRSTLSSFKELSRKRDLEMIYGHRNGEDDYHMEININSNLGNNHDLSNSKKLKRALTSDCIRKSQMEELMPADSKSSVRCKSFGVIKASSGCEGSISSCKARPVVCGKFGEISSGEHTGDASWPVKIVSLSKVLKNAKRCAIRESRKPKVTFPKELKKTGLSGSDADLKTEEESGMDLASIFYEMNLSVVGDKICPNGDKLFVDEKSISEKECENEGKKKCMTLNTSVHAKVWPKSKEIRKRSLLELTEKGRTFGSESFAPMKSAKTMPKVKMGKILKNAESDKHHIGGSCKVGAEKSLSAMDLDAFCCVCGGSNKDEINCLLECHRCFIKVHQACYGVSRVPKGHWYCRPCRTSSKDIVCVLCGYSSGAMTQALRCRIIVKSLLKAWNVETECRPKNAVSSAEIVEDDLNVIHSPEAMLNGNKFPVLRPVNIEQTSTALWKADSPNQLDNVHNSSCCINDLQVHNSITAGLHDSTVKQWVHMVCGLWTPGTRCPNVDTMSAFDVSGVSRPKANMVCSMCNRPGGSCIRCRVVNCSIHFHPWCAHQKHLECAVGGGNEGLLQSEVEGVENENVGFYGRCVFHATHPLCESHGDHIDNELNCSGERELTCARTEGYKGRKRDGFWYNLYGQSRGKSALVSQEQLNAWIHINGQKSSTHVLQNLPVSDIESDCRKEYARYKQTKGWKHLVVYKSNIHALGLYTSRFISRGKMVVEYVGEIVGLRVADKRENEYDLGRKLQYKSACYFFRIDKEHIIDATCKGGIARFVNHSCLPNCVAKVISVRNDKKVVFFAERDIYPGEEITYDYHFNHEDEGKKIPCFCNSKNCRRYLN